MGQEKSFEILKKNMSTPAKYNMYRGTARISWGLWAKVIKGPPD